MKKMVLILICLLVVGCAPETKTKLETTEFETVIIDMNHEKFNGVDIFYDGNKITTTDEEGYAQFIIDTHLAFNMSLVEYKKTGYQFHILETTYNDDVPKYFIMGMLDTEPANWFDYLYEVSGKIVLHSDGETRILNSKLIVNDKRIIEVDESGNFDILYIYKGFTIKPQHDEYNFVDINNKTMESFIIKEKIEGLTFRGVEK